MKIGGNTTALVQIKTLQKNDLGERIPTWTDITVIHGWLDLSTGTSEYQQYSVKMQESTHIFICDYQSLKNLKKGWVRDPFRFTDGTIKNTETGETANVSSDTCRMTILGRTYAILLIDDPMGMHQQLEIYLKLMEGV